MGWYDLYTYYLLVIGYIVFGVLSRAEGMCVKHFPSYLYNIANEDKLKQNILI